MAVQAMLQEVCRHFINKMYRLCPDVSSRFCGLHYVRRRTRYHSLWQPLQPIRSTSTGTSGLRFLRSRLLSYLSCLQFVCYFALAA